MLLRIYFRCSSDTTVFVTSTTTCPRKSNFHACTYESLLRGQFSLYWARFDLGRMYSLSTLRMHENRVAGWFLAATSGRRDNLMPTVDRKLTSRSVLNLTTSLIYIDSKQKMSAVEHSYSSLGASCPTFANLQYKIQNPFEKFDKVYTCLGLKKKTLAIRAIRGQTCTAIRWRKVLLFQKRVVRAGWMRKWKYNEKYNRFLGFYRKNFLNSMPQKSRIDPS